MNSITVPYSAANGTTSLCAACMAAPVLVVAPPPVTCRNTGKGKGGGAGPGQQLSTPTPTDHHHSATVQHPCIVHYDQISQGKPF